MIPILHDGSCWIAVDKPAGLPTQAPSPHPSLESRLKAQLSDRTKYIAMPHRLDVPVGGVILVALTKKAARLLSEQFAARKMTKRYQAIVDGDARSIATTWTDHIRKIDGQAKVELVDEGTDLSRVAQTNVEKVDFDDSQHRSRLTLRPVTGRMHQLRIGAASRGFPIIGDPDYQGSDYQSDQTVAPTLKTCIELRAMSIQFRDPTNGKRILVEADPLPWS